MSQARVAQKAKVDPATFGDMLRGIRSPRPESLRAICKALGVNPSFIKTGVGERYARADGQPAIVQAPNTGIERWLATQQGVSLDEQAWLRAVPWPDPHIQYHDLVYITVLQAFRNMREQARSLTIAASNGKPDGHAR